MSGDGIDDAMRNDCLYNTMPCDGLTNATPCEGSADTLFHYGILKNFFLKKRGAFMCAVLAIAVGFVFLFALSGPDNYVSRRDNSGQRVALRDFPYPYRAMVALVNDCDNTTLRAFERYHRFLNTREQTIYGTGLGLDISDSFFMYTTAADYKRVMTYFLGTDPYTLKDARVIERYIRCGWIDTLHTYGDFSTTHQTIAGIYANGAVENNASNEGDAAGENAISVGAPSLFSRELASGAYASLSPDGIFPTIWTDHGNEGNIQNFGSYGPGASSEYKRGDAPSSKNYYHTDITLTGGVKYVWDAKYSDRFGAGFPFVAKTLRDGQKLWSFNRYTGADRDGASPEWYPDKLRFLLTEARLSALVEKRQYGLFAQHLGYYGEEYKLDAEDVAALRLLAEFQHERNEILVAGTVRLFEYATARAFVGYATAVTEDSYLNIDITAVEDPLFPDITPSLDRLRGLTFYCDDSDHARISIRGAQIGEEDIVRNPADETGRPSISIRWHTQDTTDYSRYG